MSTSGGVAARRQRVERATGVTNSGGDVTFTWSPPFSGPPIISATVEAGAGFRSLRIADNTASATTVHVDQTNGLTLLGVGVLAIGTNAAGVTVHATATEP